MTKKEVVLALLLLVFVFSFELVSATGDVAYIYRKNFKIDQNIIGAFNDLGLSVDLIKEDNQPSNYNDYKLIFVGDENFRKNIPVNDYPAIVADYDHANTWGLTDGEGVSQLGANHPLSVLINGNSIQVHTQAFYGGGGTVAIPYYYLDQENVGSAMEQYAATETTSSGYKIGDVISFANAGSQMENGKTQQGKLCFFGIIESDYWTSGAKDLFEDCAGFVASECLDDSECPNDDISEPFCKNGDIYETTTSYSCGNPGQVNSQCVHNGNDVLVEDCNFGCENGECIQPECLTDADCNDGNSTTQDICHNPATAESFCTNEEIKCFNDGDCGIDGFIGSPICEANNVTQDYKEFMCHNSGTAQSYCSSSTENVVVEMCFDLCMNGACVDIECYTNTDCDDSNPLTFDQCNNPGTIVSECVNTPVNCAQDSDCGFTGFLGEEFCSENNVTKNYQTSICHDSGTLGSYCATDVTTEILQTCQNACLDGTCIICDENIDCDDGNSETEDICHNPGTIQSYCENQEEPNIECSVDSDCGNNENVSILFCSADNVEQLVRTWDCNNPGTVNSYCSSDVAQELVEGCTQYCSDGACVEIECFNHTDCDDGNSTTFDWCMNAGTPESFCENNPLDIICSSDSNCGLDGYITDNICYDNDVVKWHQEFTCHNSGTVNSYCSSDVAQELVEQCDFVCSGEVCLPAPPICGNGILEGIEKCDDGNLINGDGCNSMCEIEIVECYADNDCGTDGFVGSPFCSENNVTRSYKEFTCNNPGTVSSHCSFDVENRMIEECDGLCDNGECIDVLCFDDEECGLNGFIGSKYCVSDYIYQDYKSFMCVEPGTINSSCASNSLPNLIEHCAYACYNGQCIRCNENVDCNDGNSATQDICMLPGAINSYCENTPICQNECANGARQCVGENGARICGDFDGNGCSEWSGVAQCGYGRICRLGYCSLV